MNESIFPVFLVVFREALEAGLIIGIILTAIARIGQKNLIPVVLGSVLAAAAASVLAGIGIMSLTESAQGSWDKIIEGVISLAACGVLTYMVFWMEEQSRKLKSSMEEKVEAAATKGEIFAVILLPFLAVFREGAETVLFLSAIAAQNSASISTWGAVSGLLLAVIITYFIFWEGRRVPLKPLFKWSGYLLLFMSAGLLAYGIHELQEIGWIPEIIYPFYNINLILNEKEGIGSFLKALFGYNGNPSLIEVIAYLGYLITCGYFLKKKASA